MWNRKNLSMMFCQMAYGLSFYGVMVILTPFFLEELKYSEADTVMVIGAFSAVGTLFSIAGGFIGDRFLGAYRSLVVAYLGFTLGYVCLILGGMALSVPLSLLGIALASYGRGLMAPNYPTLFKTTFGSQEDFEKGYPINYSINNVGAFIGQYVFPFLTAYIAYRGNFTLAAVMCALAVGMLVINTRHLRETALEIDKTPVSSKNWLIFLGVSLGMLAVVFYMFSDMEVGKYIVYAISFAAIGYFMFLMTKATKAVAIRMGTILIMVVLTIAFFVYYGQMMTSMNLVAINTMRGDLFGIIPLKPEGQMVMNPLWCAVAGPVIAFCFNALEKRNIFLTTATKVGIAFVLTACAFGTLTLGIFAIGEDVVIRPEIFLIVHFFQGFAEVVVGSLVVAFILSVAPKNISGFSVSLFMVAMALSGIVAAVFSTSIALEKGVELTQEIAINTYGNFFMMLTFLAIAMVVVAFISSFVIKKMLKAADALDGGVKTEETAE